MHNVFYKLVNDLDANWHKRSTALRHEMVSFVGQEVKDQGQEVKGQGHNGQLCGSGGQGSRSGGQMSRSCMANDLGGKA